MPGHGQTGVIRRRNALAWTVCSFVLALVAGCSGGRSESLDVTLELDPDPPRVGPTMLVVGLSEGGSPVTGAVVRVEGNMNHAGMVPVFAEPTETEPGRYRGELEFTMGGDWFLIVTAETADGRSLSSTVDVPGVQPRRKSGE